jgi:hypothetical protein
MAGKNKVERWMEVHFDDSGGSLRNLSASLVPGTWSGGGLTAEEAEMTGVSEAVRNYLAGHSTTEGAAQFYLDDTATTGAHTVLKGMIGKVGTLTIKYGSAAAPTTGDPVWSGEFLLVAAPIQLAGNRPVIAARWVPGSGVAPTWDTIS